MVMAARICRVVRRPSQVTVGPEHRRLGLANRLMEGLEEISDGTNCYFVDLFVRFSLYHFHMMD